ncbi:MAG: DUF4058 family protein [Planctomycetales bacterium]
MHLVQVSRVELRPKGEYYPIELPQRLPTVLIPLLAEDGSAPLDLQQALDAAYSRAGYDLELDYSAPPTVPLAPEQAEWARQILARR